MLQSPLAEPGNRLACPVVEVDLAQGELYLHRSFHGVCPFEGAGALGFACIGSIPGNVPDAAPNGWISRQRLVHIAKGNTHEESIEAEDLRGRGGSDAALGKRLRVHREQHRSDNNRWQRQQHDIELHGV